LDIHARTVFDANAFAGHGEGREYHFAVQAREARAAINPPLDTDFV
jgi:hypothetical protein